MIAREIIDAFVAGEKKGFDALYASYAPGMFMICLRYTRCRDDAQDVLQEAFIRVFSKRETYDQDRPIGPWIKTIVIRCALSYIRENYRFQLTEDESQFDRAMEEEAGNSDQGLKDKLLDALNKLPDGYRTVFNLFAIDNLTHKEIAAYLGITEGTSKSQYAKARKMLQQVLQPERVAS